MTVHRFFAVTLVLVLCAAVAAGEECLTTGDMDAATKAAIENTARQFYQYSAAGDAASLRANAIPAISGNFGGIERAVADNKDALAGAQPGIHSTYILDATGGPPTLDAMFVCGVYNSRDRLEFSIPNLPAAKYALVIMEANGAKGPYWLTLILQQAGPRWQLAGFYPKARRVGDKGIEFFLPQARQYRARGELHNAYFYYLTARDLALPVSFMMTRPVERLDTEVQPIVPKDLPGEQPVAFNAGSKSFQLTQIYPVPVGNGINLVVKYQALGDVNDTRARFNDNMELIKAFATRYPEYKAAFAGIVARAVDTATGADYGTVLAMNDIK